jgi:hypothetical protein
MAVSIFILLQSSILAGNGAASSCSMMNTSKTFDQGRSQEKWSPVSTSISRNNVCLQNVPHIYMHITRMAKCVAGINEHV